MDFWKYLKQETPITKPQLFRIGGGGEEKKSVELFMAFFTDIRQYPS